MVANTANTNSSINWTKQSLGNNNIQTLYLGCSCFAADHFIHAVYWPGDSDCYFTIHNDPWTFWNILKELYRAVFRRNQMHYSDVHLDEDKRQQLIEFLQQCQK